ncbi:MAG: sulfotransferase domain-containing protein [Deltaproteobacteria bacterium]|nr:sulfotransferase domain-containing protein [Deltaproteobacteria bacterium]
MDKRPLILPDFLIIGSGRCGTSFLYECLKQHPEIYLKDSKTPEPHFFLRDSEYEKGLAYYSEKYFSRWRGEKKVGEASVNYLFFERAAARAHRDIPDVKLICMVRNPIDRIFSAYCRSVETGWEDLSFERALDKEQERTQNPPDEYHRQFEPRAYTKKGFYLRHIEMWLNYFDRSRLFVGVFEEMVRSPMAVIKEVFRFLQVDEDFVPIFPRRKVNASALRDEIKMNPETRRALKTMFEAENKRLAKFLGRSLDIWEN